MPRDIDDQMRRPNRDRERGETSGEEIRDRKRRDPDMSGSDHPDQDPGRSGTRGDREDRRSSWDEDELDEQDRREGYR
ncbi:hypothetical protein AB0N14_11040 [Streptomyces sp. NPDC051104]|uniref:hypothetical protein n=1 Tax=Streptomyces sp. NPDC051104 TaxID=3155044 RepID=UPI00341F9FC0